MLPEIEPSGSGKVPRPTAHVLFGEVDLARRELSQVKWEGRPPIVRALEHNVESLIHMRCTGEPAHGLALERETAAMAELPSSWPGAKTARAEPMRQLIQQMAPHCRPFQQLPS